MTAEVAFLSHIQKLNGMSAADSWNVLWTFPLSGMTLLGKCKHCRPLNNDEGRYSAGVVGGSKIIDEVEQSEIWKSLGRQEILIHTLVWSIYVLLSVFYHVFTTFIGLTVIIKPTRYTNFSNLFLE